MTATSATFSRQEGKLLLDANKQAQKSLCRIPKKCGVHILVRHRMTGL
jgi:hypothetical protein